ncbi:MAG: hypothetical protein RIS94_3027 [Pseudomonadota bacterium]|jgi:uncharacterized membrane protein
MRGFLVPVMAGAALSLAGCASNYAGEGALAGGAAGALIGAASGNVAAGAAIGAAAGAAGGSLIHKNGHCYRRDDRGYEHQVRC